MITIRRTVPVAIALTFVAASCGGSSADDTDVTDPATIATDVADEDLTEADTTAVATAPVASIVEEPAGTEPPTEAAGTEPAESAPVAQPTDGAAAAATFDVTLEEWEIGAPVEYSAGDVTFNATNIGGFPHEFVVIEGEGYEALPLTEAGAVIEDDLPTGALLGRTGRLGGGSSEALTVTLAPGNYVLLCNLGGGGNSHAGQGQRLDITVS